MQSGKAVWPWVLGVVVIGGAGGWLFRDQLKSLADGVRCRCNQPRQYRCAATTAGGRRARAGTTAIRHPLDTEAAADPALPKLADSDAAAWGALSQLFQGEGPLTLLLRDHLIQRLVTQVDNLDKPSVPPTALAARPLPGNLQVEPGEGGERIAASNAARYAPYVQAFTALDPAATATAYKRFYPLIQQAYVDLGRPEGYFNDRLVAVIDHLLDTPELAQAPLVQRDERGRYRFVDPTLQSRSIGQKALLRMDLAQARAVKQQLRAIRSAITR
jgi:GNAT superfamily N-acetyltransferase